jgi:hypothetical protein
VFPAIKLAMKFAVPGAFLAVWGLREIVSGDAELGWAIFPLGVFCVFVGALIGYKIVTVIRSRRP